MARNKIMPYIMILPAMTVFFLFSLIPIGYMIYLSFHDWNFVTPDMNFIGITNFTNLISDFRFRQVLLIQLFTQ